MTDALQQAIERLQQVPQERQDALAALLIHELDEDERWTKSTDANAEKLNRFVGDVIDASRRGEYETLDPDTM